ncbi:MAG: ATP-binding protein [Desulfobacterales bacterium]|nr:ATP-binding protein [Desulfobacterales bacterium]
MANWWEYYNLQAEPRLSPDPLTRREDQSLFIGRDSEQQAIKAITQGNSTVAVLITGNPGVGKTTLVHHLFMEVGGFIYVDLSNAQRFIDVDVEIAEACILAVKKHSARKATDLRDRLLSTTSQSTGRNLKAGIAPGGIGGEMTSLYQETMAPVRNIEVREIIRETLEYLGSKKQHIVLFLDESDFFDGETTGPLTHLCKRVKGMLPSGSVLLLANRDLQHQFSDAYRKTGSLVRSTFRHYHPLDSLWEEGKGNIPEFLGLRLKRGKVVRGYQFPLSQKSCHIIDVLSMGNFKLLLQYAETSLIYGSLKEAKIPLTAPFVKKLLFEHFPETSQMDEDELKVIKHLENTPTHVNDSKFKGIVGSRTNLQHVLARLEDRRLVKRDIRRKGVKQVFSVTQKGIMILAEQ